MKIRHIKSEDARKASYMIRKTLFEVNSKDYTKEVLKRVAKDNTPKRLIEKSRSTSFHVAVEGNKILGTASLREDFGEAVFVNPRFHDQGIGTALMMVIEEEAKKKGIKKLRVESSFTAESFYEQLGYKKFKKGTHEKCGEVVEMVKQL